MLKFTLMCYFRSFWMSVLDFKDFIVGTLIDFEGDMLACLRSAVPKAGETEEYFRAAYRHSRADGDDVRAGPNPVSFHQRAFAAGGGDEDVRLFHSVLFGAGHHHRDADSRSMSALFWASIWGWWLQAWMASIVITSRISRICIRA